MIFKNTEELRLQLIADGACDESIEWGKDYHLDYILENTSIEYRHWGLMMGYTQFEDFCLWNFNTVQWFHLLRMQPQYANKVDWSIFSEEQKTKLIQKHPQLSEYV